jgi:hypothetical protein
LDDVIENLNINSYQHLASRFVLDDVEKIFQEKVSS